VRGYNTAPSFYFLRTENGFYYYNSIEENSFYGLALDDSKLIEEPLKKEIISFIKKRCQSKNGLRWFTGLRWY